MREATAAHEGGAEDELPPVPCAVVAVASGDGIRRIFRSLKVHKVVAGGQTMNPTTEDLLAAVEAAPADDVVLLPNNKNIVPVAEAVGSPDEEGGACRSHPRCRRGFRRSPRLRPRSDRRDERQTHG